VSRLDRYLNNEGRIKVWPSKKDLKLETLRYLSNRFEYGRIYTEKEVNTLIDGAHTFGDYFLLRRELIESSLLCRTRNCSRYWRGDIWPMGGKAETERLVITDSVTEETAKLQNVYMSCSYMGDWTGTAHTPEYIDTLLDRNDLPPNGSSEFLKVKTIYEKATQDVIGILSYYLGYPDSDTIWIGLLVLQEASQHHGFGSEITGFVLTAAASAGFKKAGIGVYLQNWPALRFWTGQGFNKITGIHGDRVYSASTYSLASLEKAL
jgi:GNAT superfamily N-acetyltransferase